VKGTILQLNLVKPNCFGLLVLVLYLVKVTILQLLFVSGTLHELIYLAETIFLAS